VSGTDPGTDRPALVGQSSLAPHGTSAAGAPGSAESERHGFGDVVAANERYAQHFTGMNLSGRAARGLAVITCMDSRIDPLGVLGMHPGDAKILRNAGARVTDDVLRTLVLACYLLEVHRVLVMPHTRCAMIGREESDIHAQIAGRFGVDTRGFEFRTAIDVTSTLRGDVQRIRSFPLLPAGLPVAGAVYNVDTGLMQMLDD